MLGVAPEASRAEIKAAYRALVKRHHPDAGGDTTTILALNAAWEVLGDSEKRRRHDRRREPEAVASTAGASRPAGQDGGRAADWDGAVQTWFQQVYGPIDRLLGQVINPFAAQLKALSADPYDDRLMEAFCRFLELSQTKLARVETLYQSLPCPPALKAFSLDLYHCLSLVKDALVDLERYTMGYVDSYLRDGRELLRKARMRRRQLQHDRRQLIA
ncbi:DnaJ-class molecular chaperone [Cyanobium sp. NIES-981]|nr:DnaJ-class molecular chaperone [Cyanobium sp. NIES-981]